MPPFQVLFEIPPEIQQGLASGTMERIGGVIRNAAGRKEIIAWLRDGADLHRQGEALQAVAAVPQTLTAISVTGQLLNLALATASLQAIAHRLDRLSDEVATLSQVMRVEFKRDRDTEFKSALRLAEKQSANPDVNLEQAFHAIRGLYSAHENFYQDYEEALDQNPALAQHYLIRAMYASVSYIRCYLEIGELNSAKADLQKDYEKFDVAVRKLVERWLGEHPAEFLHKSIDRTNMDRFIKVQQWLYPAEVGDISTAVSAILDIVDRLRVDFWNLEVLQNRSTIKVLLHHITRRPDQTDDRVAELLNRLAQAEAAIENIRRLKGFEMELRTMRLSFSEWRDLVPAQEIQDKGLALIVPEGPG